MNPIVACDMPAAALLQRYREHGYTDCFSVELAGVVTHRAFVEAFYTTPLFKLERLLLRWFAARPSSDQQARELAAGCASTIAAWHVEDRAENQLLLAAGRTRSWLMTAPAGSSASGERTRLYFGSAVVPRRSRRTGNAEMGAGFSALLGLHTLYSRLLLAAARARLLNRRASTRPPREP